MTVLNAYISDWFKLLEENKNEIFGEDSPAAEDFMEGLPIAKEVVAAIGQLKGISAHTRKEEARSGLQSTSKRVTNAGKVCSLRANYDYSYGRIAMAILPCFLG